MKEPSIPPSYEESTHSEFEDDSMSMQDSLSTNNTSVFSRICDLQLTNYDILPSFYMHQSVLNRSLYIRGESDILDPEMLPTYDRVGPVDSNQQETVCEHLLCLTRDNSILDNIEKVPETESPIELSIYLTKKPGSRTSPPMERENVLKEYTSGDYVYGHYTIKNVSSENIRFEQITVALEGNSGIQTSQGHESQNFMRLIDLAASYTPSGYPLKSHREIIDGVLTDKYDGSLTYLPNEQILEPGITYKKYFTFKLPVQLLDQSCESNQLSHLMLPPSLGVAPQYRRGIEFNKALGYGRTNTIGGPVLMDDYAPFGTSIDYSVVVRIVGFNPNHSNHPEELMYSILKKKHYFIRFIPFGFCIPFNYELSTQRQLEILQRRIRHELEEAKRRLATGLEIGDELPELSREEQLERKLEQLTIPVFPLPNSSKEQLIQKTSLDIFPKKKLLKKNSTSKSDKIGTIHVQSDTPVEGIPYVIPSFIHKINAKSNMNLTGKNNINIMDSALTMTEKANLQNIELELIFKPSKNCTKPPSLDSITADLEINTLYSSRSIPFTIDQDFLTSKENLKTMQREFSQLSKEFKKLPPKTKILAKTLTDLNSIINMKLVSSKIPFFKITQKTITDWEAKQQDAKGLQITWCKKISLQLQVNDVKNLTLVPTFQNCYMSRFYNVSVDVSFGDFGKTNLSIPVRVRKFDWKNNE